MSHYTSVQLEIRDRDALVAALADLGFDKVEVHEEPQHLYGYEDDERQQKAEIIIRRKYVGDTSNDIGFRRTKGGAFSAIISEYDTGAGYGTVDLNVKMLRPVPTDKGDLVAEGRVIHLSGRLGVAEGTLKDADGVLYAHGTATCMIRR